MALRPIINPDAPTIEKVDPNISFSQNEFDIYEKNLKGEYEFDWFQYLVNPDHVSYTVKLSDGLAFIDDTKFTWSDSGNYTLTVTTTENEYYNSVDIVMTFHIYTLSTSGVEYMPNPLVIKDGDLEIEYFNVEKREGVYMFDLIKPNNPNSLNVKYKIEGKNGCTIDDDDYKVHIAKKGRYKITAYFEGNSSYRPSETVYYLVYGQDGDEDDKDPYDNKNNKKYPGISFSKSSVSFDKNDNSIYDILKANNPNNVQLTYTSDTGNLIDNNTKVQVPEDFTGNIKITCTSQETSKYYSQTINYIITVSVPEEEKSDDYEFHFSQDTDNQIVRQSHKYTVLHLTNTSPLDYTLTVSKPATVSADKTEIECGITGTFTVIAKTIPNSIYKSKEARYTLNIQESDKQVPIFEFIKTQDTWQQNKDGAYPLLALNNRNNLEYTISCDNPSASIQDNMLYFNELGTITITATSKETDEYISVSAMYILYIIEATKQNANISFTYDRINIKKMDDESQGYPIQPLNNPNGVALNPYTASSGSVRDGRLYVNGPTELYIQVTSIEDDTYFATTARYTVNIYTGLKSWPNFQVHNDYEIIDNLNKTKNIELLRWPKSDNLAFNSSEWRVSVSKPICTVSNITMTETESDCVLYGDIKFSEEGYVRFGITFYGNDDWESASNMGLNIRYTRKTLISPELSFPNYYVIVDQSVTNTYVIQEVQNPFDVEVTYYVSNGDLNGNILTFSGTGNIIVTCTSVATDVYASQSVQYTLHINKPKKISPGLYFEHPIVEYEQGTYSANEYPLQDVLPNPLPVPIKSWNATNQAIVYYNNGHTVKYNGVGDVIVSVTSQETAVYYSETVYYTMRIVESSSLLDPELYYDPAAGEVYVNDEGQYELPQPHLADESLRNLLTFRTQNNLGSVSDDGTMLSVDGTWNVRVYAEFAGDGTYRAASTSYVLRIQAKPAKHLPDIMFRDQRVSFNSRGANGEYELQTTFIGAQADIGGEYYVNQAGVELDLTNHKIKYPDNSGDIIIYYKTNETDEYLSAIIHYEVLISQYSLNYLDAELIQSNTDITGPYNTDIEIRPIKWLKSKNYTFDAAEWTITTTESSCTPKIVRSEPLDENYNVLVISCAFSSEKKAPIRITFLGDDEFYSQSDFNILYVNFTKAKSMPDYYFSPNNVSLEYGTPGNVYKLSDYTQLRGVPSDLNVNIELVSNSPDTFTDGVVTINRNNVNSFFIRAWNNETANYYAYSTQFRLAWTNQYVKGTPDLTLKNKIGGVLSFYWDPNNKYIVEIDNPDNIDILESDIIWDTEGLAKVTPLGSYRYEVSLYENTNEIHQFNIRFMTRDTLEYESVTDYAVFSVNEYERTDVEYTMHADYNYTNITVGETIKNIELLEFTGDDITADDFEVTVESNGTINYISVSNVRINDNKLICNVRTWPYADTGSNNIYVKYKGSSVHTSFLDHLNFTYSVDSQYVRENVISVSSNPYQVQQNIPDNNYYDLQAINDVYNISPTVYYEELYCDRITGKIHTDGLNNYTVTAYTNDIVKDDILYKATRIQYTFQLVENTGYIDDGSLYFDYSSQTFDQNVQGRYQLQGVTNEGMWTLEWSAEDALGNEVTISDGYINYNDVGLITITVRTVNAYPRRKASYTLLIREALGINPDLYFTGDVNYRLSERYRIDKPQGEDSDTLLPYCTISASNGNVTKDGDEYYLTGNFNIGDVITISCYFPGNSTYNSTEISYRITITAATGSSNLLLRKWHYGDEYDIAISYIELPRGDYVMAYIEGSQDYRSNMYNKNDFNFTSKNNDNYIFTAKSNKIGIDKPVVVFTISNIYRPEGPYNCNYILPLSINFKGNEKYAPTTLDCNVLIGRIPKYPSHYFANLGPVFKGEFNFSGTKADNYITYQFGSYLPYDESGEYYIDSSYNYMFSYDYVSNPNNIQTYNRYMNNGHLELGRRYDGSKLSDCLYLINPDPRSNCSYCINGRHVNNRYPKTEISLTSMISFEINTRTINIGNLIPNTIKIKRNGSGIYDLSKALPVYTNYMSYSTHNYRGNKINVGIRYYILSGYNKDGDTIVDNNIYTYANVNKKNILRLGNYNYNYNTVDFVYRIAADPRCGYIENTSKNKYKFEGNIYVNITLSNDADAIECAIPSLFYFGLQNKEPINEITIYSDSTTEVYLFDYTGYSGSIYFDSSNTSVARAYINNQGRLVIHKYSPGTCIIKATIQDGQAKKTTQDLHVTCT